jgi:hypothetical protein
VEIRQPPHDPIKPGPRIAQIRPGIRIEQPHDSPVATFKYNNVQLVGLLLGDAENVILLIQPAGASLYIVRGHVLPSPADNGHCSVKFSGELRAVNQRAPGDADRCGIEADCDSDPQMNLKNDFAKP